MPSNNIHYRQKSAQVTPKIANCPLSDSCSAQCPKTIIVVAKLAASGLDNGETRWDERHGNVAKVLLTPEKLGGPVLKLACLSG